METNELHRGRLVDHLQIVVRDLAASRRFYDAVMQVLGIPFGGEGEGFFWYDEFVASSTDSDASEGRLTGPSHFAFQAKDRDTVVAFYHAALRHGGTSHGAPGERAHYHPGYYAAFVRDPDGNNVEAVYHGEGKRSAASVKITF